MTLRPVVLALIAPILLAGCGQGRTVRVAGHRVTLALEEYRILPQTLSVPAGRLRIVAENRGILTHNLELQQGSPDSTERTTLARIHTLLPGANGTVVTGPLAPGRYLLLSTVDNQAVLGMSGTLVVR